jgi:hypothetical protein
VCVCVCVCRIQMTHFYFYICLLFEWVIGQVDIGTRLSGMVSLVHSSVFIPHSSFFILHSSLELVSIATLVHCNCSLC